jgi:hypothetical protein
MAEANQASETKDQKWARSPAFRSIFSNFFQYRLGYGEIAVMLGTITSDSTPAGTAVLEQEAEIFMTWAQLKNLTLTMQLVIQTIESEIGPIPIALVDQEAALDNIRTHVRKLNLSQWAQPKGGDPS